LLPLVHLHEALQLPSTAAADEALSIVVVKADQRQFGLVVETVHDTEEIVVKPLGQRLKGLAAFAGATIMGDGQIALILDVLGIAQMTHVVSETRATDPGASADRDDETVDDSRSLLVFQASEQDRMALPLQLVARLEEIPRSVLERSGDRTVMQYRGEILPLVSVAGYFNRPEPEGDLLQVIVYASQDLHVGLVVTRIIDIVEQRIVVDPRHTRRGLLGSTVLQMQVTDLLDADAVIADAGLLACAVA
ncbi:MAG TPA: chemotaxis protein CheW, partial [Luteitalea sp.]|nr:chemotaxis protein CheW [Luteitalea sp.]